MNDYNPLAGFRQELPSSSSDEKYADQVRYEWYMETGQWLPRLPGDTKGAYPKYSTSENELKNTIFKEQEAKLATTIKALEIKIAITLKAIFGKDGAK